MANEGFDKLSFGELADFYFDVRNGIYYEQSNLLALKKLLFESDKNQSIKKLGMDPLLDSINYSKKFRKEADNYIKYIPDAFFDKNPPADLTKYLTKISRKSKMKKRLIAARIQDECFSDMKLNMEEFQSSPQTLYDIALEYYFSTAENLRDTKEALHFALCEVILYYPAKSQIKIMGQDNFLDARLCEQKINNLELDDYLEEAQKLMIFDSNCTKEEKYYSLLEELIEYPQQYLPSLIAQKILPNYSVEKLKLLINEEENEQEQSDE